MRMCLKPLVNASVTILKPKAESFQSQSKKYSDISIYHPSSGQIDIYEKDKSETVGFLSAFMR